MKTKILIGLLLISILFVAGCSSLTGREAKEMCSSLGMEFYSKNANQISCVKSITDEEALEILLKLDEEKLLRLCNQGGNKT